MPIYQYQCTACGHSMEALQKMSDALLRDCPECNQPALKKQVTAAAFKLKGTGWYETDFKNSGKPSAPAKNNAAEGDSAKSKESNAGSEKSDSANSASPAKSGADSASTSAA